MNFLTPGASNAKLAKTTDFAAYILHLSPAETVAGISLCPASTPGCRASCLATAGRGRFPASARARHRRSEFLRDHPAAFMALLVEDLEHAEVRAAAAGKQLVVRLNGTSDVAWEDFPVRRRSPVSQVAPSAFENLMDAFPQAIFYDYTKRPERVARMLGLAGGRATAWPATYHLCFSRSESNETIARRFLDEGATVSVVFRDELPHSMTWWGRPVIDGTADDHRWRDAHGCVVGLLALGEGRSDRSGFVVSASGA